LKTVVGDNVDGCRHFCDGRSADLVALTGGLGPTADDITRDAVASVLGLPFDEDEATVARIRERFTRRAW
jgi:nicotinamide-nucleotide amidase